MMEETNIEDWPLPPTFGADDDAHLKALLAAWKEDERKRLNRVADAEQIFQHTLLHTFEADGTHWSGTGERHVEFKKGDDTAHLVVGEYLGRGSFGTVKTISVRALKMARKKIDTHGLDNHSVESLKNEVRVMERLVHRHLVRLVGSYTSGSKLCILTFPVALCTFEQVLDEYEKLQGDSSDVYSDDAEKALMGKKVARAMLGFARTKLFLDNGVDQADELVDAIGRRLNEITGCVATAVEWMHAESVRHLDLKPENIVLNPGEVYITDFGLSRDFKDRTVTRTELHSGFTPGYAAPEVQRQEQYNPSSADVYSLGCIYLHIATVRHAGNRNRCRDALKYTPTPQQSRQQAISSFLAKVWHRSLVNRLRKGDDTGELSLEFRDLLKVMLSDDPNRRPTIQNVNDELRRQGRWQQQYHGSCCKKNRHALSLLSHTRKAYSNDAKEPVDNLCGYLGITMHKLDISPSEELSIRNDLHKARQRYDEDDPRTVSNITDLVSCLRGQRKYAEARTISIQMLQNREMLSTEENADPEVLSLLRDTGILHYLCGYYEEAESMLKRAVTKSKELLGRDNPETLDTMEDLALVLQARERLREAEELFRSLEGEKRTALGRDYPGTLDTLHRLSVVLAAQGKIDDAKQHAVKTLEGRKRVLGADHPDVLESLELLAKLLNSTERAEKANEILAQLQLQKLSLQRRLLGDGHAFSRYICARMTDLREIRRERQLQRIEEQRLQQEAAIRSASQIEELPVDEPQASPVLSEHNSFATMESQGDNAQEHQASTPLSEVTSKANDDGASEQSKSNTCRTSSRASRQSSAVFPTSERFAEEEGEDYEMNVVYVRSPRISAISKHVGFSVFFAIARAYYRNERSATDDQDEEEEDDGYKSDDDDIIDLLSEGEDRPEEDPFDFPDELDQLANDAFKEQRYSEAEDLYRSTLGTKVEIYGANSSRTLKTMHFLGNALYCQQNNDEAQEVFEDTLAKRRSFIGKRHRDTLTTMFALGNVYYAKGRLEAASAMFHKTAKLRELILGRVHPDTILAAHHRGFTVLSQLKYQKAVKIIDDTLERQRIALGSEHPDTIWSIHNIGYAYHNLAILNTADLSYMRFAPAAEYYKEALSLREKTLGEDHPLTMEVLSRLCNVYLSGFDPKAETLLRRELHVREKLRGEGDLLTLESMHRLSTCLWEQNDPSEVTWWSQAIKDYRAALEKKYEEAEALILRAVGLYRTVLGTKHPTTLSAMYTAAVILKGRRKLEEARQLYSETLVMSETVLGRDHPNTVDTRRGFYLVLEGLKGFVPAEAIYQETLVYRPSGQTAVGRTVYGTSAQRHILLTFMVKICKDICIAHYKPPGQAYTSGEEGETKVSRLSSGELLYNFLEKYGTFQKKPDQQIREFEQWLIKKLQREEYLNSKGIEKRAEELENQHQYDKAEVLRREALELSIKAVGRQHAVTIKNMYKLAQVLGRQGRDEEARKLCAEAAEASPAKASPVIEEPPDQHDIEERWITNTQAAKDNRRSGAKWKLTNLLRPARSMANLDSAKDDEAPGPIGFVEEEATLSNPQH